ncbi:MAG TPA: PEGA domain-containing protein [Methanoregula sp.]|nr:PEGA domain-containing protein [Methanoregula sp.]
MILQISVRDISDNSTVPHATIFLNGTSYAKADNNGQVSITHSGLDDQLIQVTMAGYNDWENLVGKNETSVVVNLSPKSLILKVNLYDSDSLGFVSGARVNISAANLTQTKLTDVRGSVAFDVYATTLYSIRITAPDYLSREGVIDVGTETMDVQYWLLPSNRFSFVIQDKEGLRAVPDAEVRIDGVLVGRTDTRGILTSPVSRGKIHTIEITKTGFEAFTESRVINETDAFYTIVLSKAILGAFFYTLDEKHVPVNGTEIYINGTLKGTTNQFGRSTFPDLVAGSYAVEVRKTGYMSLNRTILVADSGEEFSFVMPFETANLTIFIEEKDQHRLPDVTIFVNGQASGFTDDLGRYTTRVRFNTLYNITASKDTYQTVSVQKQFAQGNATPSLTLIMEKNPDWGLITLIVAGIVGILVLFGIMRMLGGRKRRHVTRKNEI